MSKPLRDLKLALVGVCGGLFSASVFLLAARVETYYDYLRRYDAYGYEEAVGRGIENLWWVPIVTWHVVVSMTASLFIHRYLGSERVSPFLRWQAIGVVALLGWGLTLFIAVSMECLIRGDTTPVDQMWRMLKFDYVAQFLATVFAANVLYGSALQAATSEDLREPKHSIAADNPI